MSWSFKVKVENGKVLVQGDGFYPPPDGMELHVNGHQENVSGDAETIGVWRVKDGVVAFGASAQRYAPKV